MKSIDADALLAVSCVLLAIVSIFQSWQIYKLERRTSELWWKPVKHGRWIGGKGETECSACGELALFDEDCQYITPYCPFCGAAMEGVGE